MEAEAADGVGSAVGSGAEGLTGAAKGTAKGSGNGLGVGGIGTVGRGAAVRGVDGAAAGVAGGLLARVGRSGDDGTSEGLLEPGNCGVERVGKGAKVEDGSVAGLGVKGCCNGEAGLLTADAGAGLIATPAQSHI